MLTISSHGSLRDCGGFARRDFLKLGGLSLGGFGLPWLLSQQAQAAPDFARDRAVVLLFLCGGPSQIETFDPNMTAPAPWCSLTGETKTALPGVTFGATYPKLAALAKRLAVVRSYAPHEISDHAKAIRHVLTGGDALKNGASLGAMVSRLRGGTNRATGAPHYSVLIEDEVDSQYREDMERMRSSSAAGGLGAAVAPFAPGGDEQLTQDMKLNLPLEHLEDRRRLLSALDRLKHERDQAERRADDAYAAVDKFRAQAVEVILGGAVIRALDLSQEDPRTLAKYDTSRHDTGYLTRRPSTIGRQMLAARRLCEAGCSFVTVGYAGWDNHGNDKHPGVVEGMHLLGRPLDQAVAAFLEDVAERGLSEKILLVITGEFGRTPKIQQKGGRDHWPGLASLVFAGGGLKMGQVIGRSAPTAAIPSSDPHHLPHLVGTVLHTLFDAGKLRLDSGVPRDIARVVESAPRIEALFG